jgi:ATP-dependent Clp protease ATP-binding subunit ClpX
LASERSVFTFSSSTAEEVRLEDIIARRLGRGGFGFQLADNRQATGDGLLRQVKPEDPEQFGLIPEIIGRLPVTAPLDALGVDDLARILTQPKDSRIAPIPEAGQVPRGGSGVHGSGDQGGRKIALERRSGARGLRSVIEEVLEGVLFDVEAGIRYVITDRTI